MRILMKKYTITCPTHIVQPRKTKKDKNVSVSMNTYRNMNFVMNNILKKQFKEIVKKQILELKPMTKISLELILWKGSNRKIDRSNFCSIVEKYFCDALVEFKKLPDDNDEYIESTKYTTGGICRSGGYCEVVITNLSEEDTEGLLL